MVILLGAMSGRSSLVACGVNADSFCGVVGGNVLKNARIVDRSNVRLHKSHDASSLGCWRFAFTESLQESDEGLPGLSPVAIPSGKSPACDLCTRVASNAKPWRNRDV